MRRFPFPLAALLTLGSLSCGGSKDNATPTPTAPTPTPTPVVQSPTVALTLSQSKVSLGASSTLTWSSTNATSCAASGAWSGPQAISGTSTQTPATSGALAYTLTCTGAGGTASQSVALTVPIRVEKSSYENKAVAGEVLGAQTLPNGVQGGNGFAFADFFQDGSYSMVTHTLEYKLSLGFLPPLKLGNIRFWRNVSGKWVDNTTKILTVTVGCLNPRKASVADFNNDGKPDVFIACHGFDAPPFPGESPIVLLSQPDDSYKTSIVPVTCFCHNASTADVNGDGYADVLVTDFGQPFFLINNKNGTFTRDLTRLPADIRTAFTAEMIDFARVGKYDVFLGGHEQETGSKWKATILPNNGTGNFGTTSRLTLPSLQGYGFPLDIVYKSGTIYLLRTIDLATNSYGGDAIQKIAYPSLASESIYQHSGKYSSGTTWITWIIWWQGRIVSLDSMFGVSIPQ